MTYEIGESLASGWTFGKSCSSVSIAGSFNSAVGAPVPVPSVTPTENAPASIQSLDPIHHPGEIFAGWLDNCGQAPSRCGGRSRHGRPSVSPAQQIGELACVNLVALVAFLQQSVFPWNRTRRAP